MIWQSESPLPSQETPTQRKEYILDTIALNTSKEEFLIGGPRKSGKTFGLELLLGRKHPKDHGLVLMTWATERIRWKQFTEKNNIENTVIHTPDSLALYLLNSWSRREKKLLEWVNESPNDKDNKGWLDPSSYAKSLLSKGKITIGIAHWLLQNEIETFASKSMVPKADLLILDEPDQWEPEAYSWIKHLPHNQKATSATKNRQLGSKSPKDFLELRGWVSKERKIYMQRWLTITEREPDKWKDYTLVTQHTGKIDKWLCKKRGIPIRTIEQTKGREYKKVWLDHLPTHKEEKKYWGDRQKVQEKLDILSACCDSNCFAHIEKWDNSSLLPKLPKQLKQTTHSKLESPDVKSQNGNYNILAWEV